MLSEDKDENWEYYDLKEHGDTIKSINIVPDTLGETVLKTLKAFKTEHNAYLHRLDDGGLKAVR